MSIIRALALYEFVPSAAVELPLKPGDVVVVTKKNAGDGWCEGELNGKRGLFPKTFVRLITFGKQDSDDTNEEEETTDTNHTPIPPTTSTPSPVSHSPAELPLTPISSKKVFMETLLTPTPNTIKNVFNPDKAKDIFIETVAIGSGPTWKNRPPHLTIAVHDSPKGIRSSGIRMQKTYDVSTKELKVSVMRKYKHFLSLYDQLAEKVPCISLPPPPIKQSQLITGGVGYVDAQRRGLERFLNRVARHPALGSTKIFRLFLTAIDEKEWRIGTGKHTSIIRSGGGSKSSKKLLNAPIYNSIQYPPYNVPLNQLASFDKFSKFTSIMEVNLSNMQKACETIKNMHGQMGNCLRSFGKDIQNLAEGADHLSLGARYRKPTQGLVSLPNSQYSGNILPLASANMDDDDSDEDKAIIEIGEWNWRDDETFSHVMSQLHDLGSCIRHTSLRVKRHQELLTKGVIEGLEEYSGIVHTLPVLVKLHEDAMAVYNESKQKGSKTEAEDVRQDCETLNNILLAEFDYFSQQIIEDLQKVILALMKEEADYHKKMANDWENMYTSFSENKPIRRTTVKRSTTLPGLQPNEEKSSPLTQTSRPSSSDRSIKKLDVSPLTTRRPYVNITCMTESKKKQDNDEEHIYENLQSNKKSETRKSTPTYENWTPKIMSPKVTPNHSPLTPTASLPPSRKPIPPPLIIKRHELSNDQKEAERIGRQTDSFIVPNLPTHYSQVSIKESLELVTEKADDEDEEWIKQKAKIEEMGRALFKNESTTEKPFTNGSTTPKETNSGSTESEEMERRDTLTPSAVLNMRHTDSSDEDEQPLQKIEKGEDLVTRVEITKRDNKPPASVSYSPQLKSKLAQLTQLPQQRTDGTHSMLQASSKSFSHHIIDDGIKIMKPQPSRTMPKGFKKSSNSFDHGQSELVKKLERQRQRMDRQLSVDEKDSGNNPDWSHSTDETFLKKENTSLSKFGIVEDELGGTFIV